jgi:hypothetical protein
MSEGARKFERSVARARQSQGLGGISLVPLM